MRLNTFDGVEIIERPVSVDASEIEERMDLGAVENFTISSQIHKNNQLFDQLSECENIVMFSVDPNIFINTERLFRLPFTRLDTIWLGDNAFSATALKCLCEQVPKLVGVTTSVKTLDLSDSFLEINLSSGQVIDQMV